MRKSEATGAPTGREARTILWFIVSLIRNPFLFSRSSDLTNGYHKEGTTALGFGSGLLVEGSAPTTSHCIVANIAIQTLWTYPRMLTMYLGASRLWFGVSLRSVRLRPTSLDTGSLPTWSAPRTWLWSATTRFFIDSAAPSFLHGCARLVSYGGIEGRTSNLRRRSRLPVN